MNVMKLASKSSLVSSVWNAVEATVQEGSILKEQPEGNSFPCPHIGFTFPREDGGKPLRTVPGGVGARDEVHTATREWLS